MLAKKALGATAAADKLYIEDVFSTYLYLGQGTSSSKTITNGIDLSNEGGMVWLKNRDVAYSNNVFDTERGALKRIFTNATNAESTTSESLTSFNSDGFTIGTVDNGFSGSNEKIASFTFRKAEKFFDVVTYTGNGANNRQISHNLGSAPGFIIVKNTTTAQGWVCYHRSSGTGKYIFLNSTSATGTDANAFPTVTSTYFIPTADEANFSLNNNGDTYVVYLFAHDAGGFGDDGSENVISCGSYTGTGAAGNAITLGYEPQWIIIKNASTGDTRWVMFDNMRGWVNNNGGSQMPRLSPNLSNAEENNNEVTLTSTGFIPTGVGSFTNQNGNTYIYIAIRRGPMKTPTTGTSVFVPQVITESTTGLNTITSNFPVDWVFTTTSDTARRWGTRLPGNQTLATSSISAETNFGTQATAFDSNTTAGIIGTAGSAVDAYMYAFRRAPGFFDVVCYTGDGAYNPRSHNLTVPPELIIVKRRNNATDWDVLYLENPSTGSGKTGFLNLTNSFSNASGFTATSTTFTSPNDESSYTYVAYLFATLTGVSKVGSYTGTGTTLQVNCGFTGGARFVLIKRTDSTGDWYVWDSARGIVAGNDPYLLLNSTAAEVTNTDYIDTYSSGFEISSTAPAAINANGGTFIYLAIA